MKISSKLKQFIPAEKLPELESELEEYESAEYVAGLKANRDKVLEENKRQKDELAKYKSQTSEGAAEEIDRLTKENESYASQINDFAKLKKDHEKLQTDFKHKASELQELKLDSTINDFISSNGLFNSPVTKNHLRSEIKFNDKGELNFGGKADIEEFKVGFLKSDEAKMLTSAGNLSNDTPIVKPSVNKNTEEKIYDSDVYIPNYE